MLEAKNIGKSFKGLIALRDVNFIIEKGEIIGLIGPNGAGKTTLFNIISGIYHPNSGMLTFKGQNITNLQLHEICTLGIGRTFQIVRPFLSMTVLENVIAGEFVNKSLSLNDARNEAIQILDFIGLLDKKNIRASDLTLHEKKFLEIARALATNPEIMLLDEVAAGLNESEILDAMVLIKKIRDNFGITLFWIEHVMKAIMQVAERILVLHHGELIAEGSPKNIVDNEKVIDAYLGERYVF